MSKYNVPDNHFEDNDINNDNNIVHDITEVRIYEDNYEYNFRYNNDDVESDILTPVYCDYGDDRIWYAENLNNKIDNEYKIPNNIGEFVVENIKELSSLENIMCWNKIKRSNSNKTSNLSYEFLIYITDNSYDMEHRYIFKYYDGNIKPIGCERLTTSYRYKTVINYNKVDNYNNIHDKYKIPNKAGKLVINHINKEFELYDIENWDKCSQKNTVRDEDDKEFC